MFKLFTVLGALNAFLSIALGAFGAHGLKDKLNAYYMDIYHTGVQYHMMHAIGLLIVGLLAERLSSQAGLLGWAGWLMFVGIVLFSGSLYALSVTKIGVLGAITPVGGVLFLVSWLLVVISVIRA
ncbi:DUF423 domain-containing protein [Tuberibacillus calidus]|uniref:DUF423 domain-containing protein n=1 Tax=Tuberibacillus calidus TaxID=340097 RepID=UPI00041D98B9|nr:DUF423 domain-containing protein [Tuberibacillus calidus]